MNERIYTIASALSEAEEQEQELLALLCQAEERRLSRLLGERGEEWQEALLCAAAFLAAAALLDSRGAGGACSFTVGDVAVKETRGGELLRRQAQQMLAACGVGLDGFAFLGVRG